MGDHLFCHFLLLLCTAGGLSPYSSKTDVFSFISNFRIKVIKQAAHRIWTNRLNKCKIKGDTMLNNPQHASSCFDTNTTFYHHTSGIVQYFEQHFESLQQFLGFSPPPMRTKKHKVSYCALSFISGGDICLANVFSLVCTSVTPQRFIFCCKSLWNSVACHLFFFNSEFFRFEKRTHNTCCYFCRSQSQLFNYSPLLFYLSELAIATTFPICISLIPIEPRIKWKCTTSRQQCPSTQK